MAARTPASRDRHVDLLRALALGAVVLGHWLATDVGYEHGDGLTGRNALQVVPWAPPLTWLFQVMPVFFLVGGFANAASLTSQLRRGGSAASWRLSRAGRLLRPTTMLLVVLGGGALIATLLGVDSELVGTATWLASIPLWFLTVYIAVVVLAPATHALHRRGGLLVPVVLAAAVGGGDAARLLFEVPLVGEANFLLAWLAIHQAGFSWHDGRLPARPAVGLPLAGGGLVGLFLLTVMGPYPVSMVAVPGEEVQNTSPPTLALLALATAQTGLVLALRDRGNRWLRRTRPWTAVVAVNTVILTVFLWHLTAAVVAAVALYPAGVLPQPQLGTAAWFLLRLPWLVALALVVMALVAVFGRIERRGRLLDPATMAQEMDRGSRVLPRLAVVLTYVGLACVLAGLLGVTVADRGYHGPTGLPTWAVVTYLCGAAALRRARTSVHAGRRR